MATFIRWVVGLRSSPPPLIPYLLEEQEEQEELEELEELEEQEELELELELEFVCCRRRPRRRERSWSSCVACSGGFRRENSRFGSRGLASTIYNNLITGLLSLSKSHTPAMSLLCPEPKPRAFGPAARPALLKSKPAGVAMCHFCAALGPLRHCMAPQGAEGTREASGRASRSL